MGGSTRPDNGELMDLAATDIMRSSEFGVLRYNAFRRLLRLAPACSFADATAPDQRFRWSGAVPPRRGG